MTVKDLERYILSKQDVKKKVIREWRSVRYVIYSVAIATIFEYNGEPALTVFGRNTDYENKYPDIVMPSVDNEPAHFSTVLFTREVEDSVIKDMIDSSYILRLKQMVRPKSANTCKAERVPYCGIVSGYYVKDGVIKARKSCAPDEVFAALDTQSDESYSAPGEKEHENLDGIGDMNNVPYSMTITPQQLRDFLNKRKDLQAELEAAASLQYDEDDEK